MAPKHPAITEIQDGEETRYQFRGVFRSKMEPIPALPSEQPGDIVNVCGLGDLFAADNDTIDYVVRATAERPDLRFNVLTRQIERAAEYFKTRAIPKHWRMGISAPTQETLTKRWTTARTLGIPIWLSVQPILERIMLPEGCGPNTCSWVVAMAEVAPVTKARRADPEWFGYLRAQCDFAGVPFFWETSATDAPELIAERRRAAISGEPYQIQPPHLR
jgi:protein gp37